ncbi:type II secretion system protein GspL [Glaciecola sp. MH2013]|uniref:type II secretion system protein GspL n=1 Tax=Glaciecola sp. MH2013 TaxID=2785524 RepID=UPI00189C617B|nr:type II secretion system protein GspL [Glaciecola sp. MH2013]MBF7074360.1 type II secretion system protein GspL [Glaciecola sp. MH2013]
MEKLAIRLGSSLDDAIHWLVWSSAENEIIASGELPNANELTQLKERAPNADIIALVPGCDVVLKTVTLPAKANRKVLAAIPYMLEDEVASDISKSFFAFAKRSGDQQQVAIVSHEKMLLWQSALADAGLFCTKLIPDTLALPFESDSMSLLSLGDNGSALLLARNGEWSAIQGEEAWVFPVLKKDLEKSPSSIRAYSALSHTEQLSALYDELAKASNSDDTDNADALTPSFTTNYDKLPMQLLLEGAERSSFNLLQGEYALKRKSNEAWQKWRLAAVLAAVAICVNLVSKTIDLNNIKQQRVVVEQQLQASIQKGFPGLRARDKRAAIKKEMAKLENGGGGISMLVMLSQMSSSFASSGVKPQSIRFDASRTELRMQSVADNFEALEKFRRDVQALGFEVDQGAINNKGDQVVGTIVVKG